jgi:hydroxypyruvate isomerase
MPRFAANVTLMFNEWSFLDRFDAAAQAGFTAVEYLFPYVHGPYAIAQRLERNGLTQALFNFPPGNFAAGERRLASLPERFAELKEGVRTALDYADATSVKRLHLMSGNADRRNSRAAGAFRKAVIFTAAALGEKGLDLVIEPINERIYHRQVLHGDVTIALRQIISMIGHVQIASVPSRNELNFSFLFKELDRLGYNGFLGCEYRPRGKTVEGLIWFAPYSGKLLASGGDT